VAVFRIRVEVVTKLLVEKIFGVEPDKVAVFIISVEVVTSVLVAAIF
jgi:hypothetical protein